MPGSALLQAETDVGCRRCGTTGTTRLRRVSGVELVEVAGGLGVVDAELLAFQLPDAACDVGMVVQPGLSPVGGRLVPAMRSSRRATAWSMRSTSG
jgi:hypothetical protein